MVSKLSGAAGTLGVKALELKNWLIRFRCASKELWAVIADQDDWMATTPPPPTPPWAAYPAKMDCRLVTLDKRSGLLPVGIGGTLCRAITKFILRASGDQAKFVCGSLQIFS